MSLEAAHAGAADHPSESDSVFCDHNNDDDDDDNQETFSLSSSSSSDLPCREKGVAILLDRWSALEAAGELTEIFRSKSFAKILLDCLSPTGHGFEIYHDYLTSFLMTENDSRYSALWGKKNLQEKIAKQFYKPLRPSQEPLLFSFYSSPCLSRLARQVGVELVIYKLMPGETLMPYLDFRALRIPSSEPSLAAVGLKFRSGKSSSGRRSVKAICHLEASDSSFNRLAYGPLFAFAKKPSKTVSSWKNRGVVGGAEDCLSADDPDFLLPESSDSCFVDHPGKLLQDPDRLEGALWKRWGKKVLLVTFTCHALTGVERNSGLLPSSAKKVGGSSKSASKSAPPTPTPTGFRVPPPSLCKFVVIGFVGPGESVDFESAENFGTEKTVSQLGDLKKVSVICFWGSGLVCLLSEPYAEAVRQSFFKTEGSGERIPNSRLRTFVPPSKARSLSRRQQLAAQKSERRKKIDQLKKWCKCQTCSESCEYDSNMSKAGPEKLLTTEFFVPQLMKMLGLWEGSSSRLLLDRVCELSVASMDIESRTVKLDLDRPGPGPNVFYGDIDSAGLESHSRYVQLPVMLAHLDGLSACGDSSSLFTVEDDSEASVERMMKKYLARLLEGQLQCSLKKAELLAPLLKELSAYRKAYDSFCVSWKRSVSEDFERQQENLKAKAYGLAAKKRAKSGDRMQGSSSDFASCSEPKKAKKIATSPTAWNWDQFLIDDSGPASDNSDVSGVDMKKKLSSFKRGSSFFVGSGGSSPGGSSIATTVRSSFLASPQISLKGRPWPQSLPQEPFVEDDDDHHDRLECQIKAEESNEDEDRSSQSWRSSSSSSSSSSSPPLKTGGSNDNEEEEERSMTEAGRLLYQAGMNSLVRSRPACLVDPLHLRRFLQQQQQTQTSGQTRKRPKKKHQDFFDLTARAWPHTLPGQLEKKLRRLISDYSVFSFYG